MQTDWRVAFREGFAQSLGLAADAGIKAVNGVQSKYEKRFQDAFVAELKKNKQLGVGSAIASFAPMIVLISCDTARQQQ